MMLRTEMDESNGTLILRLEGRFTGEDAEHVRMLATRCDTEAQLVVNLTGVTFIDATGEAALLFFRRLGATFVADDSYLLGVCERLHLPLARSRESKTAAPLIRASRAR